MGEKNDIVVYAPTPSVTKSSLTTSGRLVSKKVQCALKEQEPLVLGAYERDLLLGYAGDALELYHKSHKDDDFQIIQVLYSKQARIIHPKWKTFQHWYHICFTAKPKSNSETDHVSPTYFFAESKLQWLTDRKLIPKYCYTFKPSDDKPGPDEHCSICSSYYGRPPPDFGKYKAHPDPGNYKVGAPPYYEGGWDFL